MLSNLVSRGGQISSQVTWDKQIFLSGLLAFSSFITIFYSSLPNGLITMHKSEMIFS